MRQKQFYCPFDFRLSTPPLHWQAILTPYLEQEPLSASIKMEIGNGAHVFRMSERTIRLPGFECPSDPESGFLIKAGTGLFAFTSYCGVAGVQLRENDGFFISPSPERNSDRVDKGVSFTEIRDGLSNTLMIGERPPNDAGYGYGAWLGSQNFIAAVIGVGETRESLADNIRLAGCKGTDFSYRRDTRGSDCGWTHHWSYHPAGANFSFANGSVHFVTYGIESSALHALATKAAGEPSKPF